MVSAKLKETRSALKNWRKNRANLTQQETDCRIVINLMDHIEEKRPLALREANLRTVIVSILSRVTQAN